MDRILKVGLALVDGGRVLLVRKSGGRWWILPGGKPEGAETDLEALARELAEELGAGLVGGSASFLGEFSDAAAGHPGRTVAVRLYAGALDRDPEPRSEIRHLLMHRPGDPVPEGTELAPSLVNSILPALFP